MPQAKTSYIVTGGATGVGRAIAQRLARVGNVVVLDMAPTLDWEHPHVSLHSGDAGDPGTARAASAEAEAAGQLVGWVNNAATFPETTLLDSTAPEILRLIAANLAPCVTGSHAAVNHFLAHDRAGSIVNISSHQAQRPVRGALPYATAKAAIEGLTRAVAVDHGRDNIRANAVTLGSINTARYEQLRHRHPEVEDQMRQLHPLRRVGTAAEAAEATAFLLSDAAAFITGVTLPVDGGRSVYGLDPEGRP